MWLIVGLGNPGSKYERNRHNIGFMVVDELARRCGASSFKSKFGGEFTSGMYRADKVLLLKPMEFMNVSGHAVSRACQFYNVEPERVLVVHDEIDFEPGRIKVKNGGGHGGHNGLRSIIKQLGDNSFARVRCGVGRPPGPAVKSAADNRVANYVLSDFPKAQQAVVDETIAWAAGAVETVVAEGVTAAMNQFNGGNPE